MKYLITPQKTFFETGKTLSLEFRLNALTRLSESIIRFEKEILEALQKDLGKSRTEAFLSEVALVQEEIAFARKNLKGWMKNENVSSQLVHFKSKAYIQTQPKGVILIIAPWNYPFQLLFSPLVGAIASGNCVSVKPSEIAPQTSEVIKKMIIDTYDPEYIMCFCGGVEKSLELLQNDFDHIFFTGSPSVGKTIMKMAAEKLIPVTLELGGKSPCIVDKNVPIDTTARRIVWGKFFNAGQTCVAPDYLIVHKSIKKELLESIRTQIQKFYGTHPMESPDYGRIVSEKHFLRIRKYLDSKKIFCGGASDFSKLYIEPTVLNNINSDDSIMQEEIFGPILPVMDFENTNDIFSIIKHNPNPLALYVFTQDKNFEETITEKTSFGGGCVNDCLIHVSNIHLPFGGIRGSGIGAYHGKYTFDLFSHKKSIVKKSFAFDFKLRYPPYKGKMKFFKFLLKS